MRDPEDGRLTYGGVYRPVRSRRLRFEIVKPGERPVRAETMNGNCVLVPVEIAAAIGNISAEYRQKMGDFDYGLRAGRAGYPIWVAPGSFGICATHPPRRTDQAPLATEVARLWSVKELPFGPWATFTRRWGGPLWPLYFVSPYVRRTAQLIGERLR
jgi:GT2 family glycosyltransferase